MVLQLATQLPLAAVGVWAFVGAFQLARRRARTATEISFILGAFAFAAYAAFDWAIFHAMSQEAAILFARASLTALTIAAFFLYLFTRLFLGRLRRRYWLYLLPLALGIALSWDGLLLTMQGGVPWNWTGVFDPGLFLVWIAIILGFALGGTANLFRAYRVVRQSSPALGWKMFTVFLVFLMSLVLGIATNTIFIALEIGIMPLFSTMLVFPGVLTLSTLLPSARRQLAKAIGRWKASLYTVLGAYLVSEEGEVLASRMADTDQARNAEAFGTTLKSIQDFMKDTFPVLLGRSLRRLVQGDVTVLIERGRHTYIALVIQGEDPDTLWIKLKGDLERFERANETIFASDSPTTARLTRVSDLLDGFLPERATTPPIPA